jgi:Zn-dependent M28 family amino/carboxypeptidase
MHHRKRLLRAGLCAALVGSLVGAPAASAQLDEVNTNRLRRAVTVNGILGHERAFQAIANANLGTRQAGTPGYDASVAYVKSRLQAAGYQVTEQEFTFPFFRELAPATFAQVTPAATTYAPTVMTYSGSGDVTGPLVPVTDIQIPPGPLPTSSTAGCEPADFPTAPAEPAVVLIQRGTCTFEIKVANAVAAGYEAVVIFNEGQEGRTGPLAGTLGRPFDIPVVGVDFATGEALYTATQAGPVTVRVTTRTEADLARKTKNVIAQTATGDATQAVVVGAHLDSVPAGPGINDNGSGSATILEIAEEMAGLDIQARRQVRFAFWGAEELGLLGSRYYVAQLGTGVSDLYANLNFDMVGSPNYVRFVYDGDNSSFPVGPTAAAGPPGSGEIEALFTRYFAARGLASEPTEFSGRSDYGPFIAVGLPAGGLFTGAEGIKTPAQAAVYGGTAGIAYDRNYHQPGDTINNLNTRALNEMSDAAAHAVQTLAVSPSGLFEDGSRRAAPQILEFKGPDLQL